MVKQLQGNKNSEFVKEAREKIGRQRLIVLDNAIYAERLRKIFQARGLNVSEKAGLRAHGFWGDECVPSEGNKARKARPMQQTMI